MEGQYKIRPKHAPHEIILVESLFLDVYDIRRLVLGLCASPPSFNLRSTRKCMTF